jgi:hypothetical protein
MVMSAATVLLSIALLNAAPAPPIGRRTLAAERTRVLTAADQYWPMRQNSRLFAAMALKHPDDIAIWSRLPADSTAEEVIRNFFIRQPLLWFD